MIIRRGDIDAQFAEWFGCKICQNRSSNNKLRAKAYKIRIADR